MNNSIQNTEETKKKSYLLKLTSTAKDTIDGIKKFSKTIPTSNISTVTTQAQKLFAFSTEDGDYGIKYLQGKEESKTIHIFVNGFTNDGGIENYDDWLSKSKNQFCQNDLCYGYSWASGKELFNHINEVGKTFLKVKGNIYLGSAFLLTKVISEWKQARNNSYAYSEALADFIEKIYEENPQKSMNLYGHSLGANLLHHTLQHLYKKKLKVNDVYLFGGAAEINKERWTDILSTSNNIYNYYSDNDKILKWLYRSMEWSSPIGLNPIVYNNRKDIGNLYNYDVSDVINGHTEYTSNFFELYLNAKNSKRLLF